MKGIKDQFCPIERITPEDNGHYFFGYYDLQPWSKDSRLHLVHRVPFRGRLQAAGDTATLGFVHLPTRVFRPLAETGAWNFQQGAMLQWHPRFPNHKILFNALRDGAYRGIILDIRTGAESVLPRPVAAVDPRGRYALSINFSRLFDFRPGYGYADIPDPFRKDPHPKDDGIFRMDLKNGDSRLLFSLDELHSKHFPSLVAKNTKLVINHITVNTDGTRFVFLLRNMPMPGCTPEVPLGTIPLTADMEGGDQYPLADFGYASHYWWKDPERLLFYIGVKGEQQLALLRDKSRKISLICPSYFKEDGHCSLSPDGRFILHDSYPNRAGHRKIYLYDVRRRLGKTLATLRSERPADKQPFDIRCDLHPRWHRSGKAVSFDSIHEGRRHVYMMKLNNCLPG